MDDLAPQGVPASTNPGQLSCSERVKLAEVADLYWVQGLKVEAVGRTLGISRSTVSRMLARARQEQVIEFIVHREEDSAALLSRALQSRYGVRVSVPVIDPHEGSGMRRLIVGSTAAATLAAMVEDDTVVAVSWGETVEAMSSQLRRQPTPGVKIVQLHGSGNVSFLGENYASHILGRFGEAFDARVHLFPVPALFDSFDTKEAMWRESSIRHALRLRASAGVLVSSVGTSIGDRPSRLYESGYLTASDMAELQDQRTVGNVAALFYRADGSTHGISVNQRTTGMPFEQIRRIPTRLFVVADPDKALALAGALRAGLITHLVIDPVTAKRLLELK